MEQRRQLARRSSSLLAPFLIALSVVCLVGSTRVQAYCFEEQRHTSAAGNNLWPGGVIPYIWDPSDPPTAQQRQRVLAVMAEFESASAGILKFLPRTNEAHYAKIIRGSKCAPGARDRAQTVVVSHIGNDGCAGWTLRHEMGHLVGLSHHAQRRDRDRYLVISGAFERPVIGMRHMLNDIDRVKLPRKFDFMEFHVSVLFVRRAQTAPCPCSDALLVGGG